MRPARGDYPCATCGAILGSPGSLGGHVTSHHRRRGDPLAQLPNQGQTVDPSTRTGSPDPTETPVGPSGERVGAAPPAEMVGEIEEEARPATEGVAGATGTGHTTYIDNDVLSGEWYTSCRCGWEAGPFTSSKDAKEGAATHYDWLATAPVPGEGPR